MEGAGAGCRWAWDGGLQVGVGAGRKELLVGLGGGRVGRKAWVGVWRTVGVKSGKREGRRSEGGGRR